MGSTRARPPARGLSAERRTEEGLGGVHRTGAFLSGAKSP
jgi:hypothetical protein